MRGSKSPQPLFGEEGSIRSSPFYEGGWGDLILLLCDKKMISENYIL